IEVAQQGCGEDIVDALRIQAKRLGDLGCVQRDAVGVRLAMFFVSEEMLQDDQHPVVAVLQFVQALWISLIERAHGVASHHQAALSALSCLPLLPASGWARAAVQNVATIAIASSDFYAQRRRESETPS